MINFCLRFTLALGKRGALLLRNTLASASSGIFAQILALATFPLLIRQVGPVDYGIFSLASATVGYFAIVNLAARASVVKYTAEFFEKDKESLIGFFNNALVINSILGIIIATFLIITALWCDKIFTLNEADIPRARQILLINAAAAFICQPLSVFGSLLYGFQKHSLVAILDMVWTIASNSIILLIFFLKGSIFWLVWEEVLMQFLKYVILSIIVIKNYEFISISLKYFDFKIIKKIFTYGGLSILYTLALIIVYQGSMIITGIIISVAAITYLQLAYKIFNIINSFSLFLSSAVLPSSSAAIAAGDKDYLNNLIIHGLKITLSIIFPFIIVFFMLSQDIIRIWIGQEFADQSGTISKILILSWLFYSPMNFLTQIYFGQQHIGIYSINAFLSALITTLITIPLGLYFGLNGIVLACSIFYNYLGISSIILFSNKFNITINTLINKVLMSIYIINILFLIIFCIVYAIFQMPENFLFFFSYILLILLIGISLNLYYNAKNEIIFFINYIKNYILSI